MSLTFDRLRSVNVARCTEGFRHALDAWSTNDWFTAIVGEIGEAADVVKKLNRCRDGIAGNAQSEAELRVDLADEIADGVIYLDLDMARRGKTFAGERGTASFGELRCETDTFMMDAAHSGSALVRRIVGALRLLETDGRGGPLLEAFDMLASYYDIDLSEAVVRKFDATSAKLGFPHRLGDRA